MTDACIFCRIVNGTIPATLVASNAHGIAFRDVNPQAPSHVLIIPRRHVRSLAEATDGVELGELLMLAAEVARAEGLEASGYRVVANTGMDGGQTVHHLHFHLFGGRSMQWPPG